MRPRSTFYEPDRSWTKLQTPESRSSCSCIFAANHRPCAKRNGVQNTDSKAVVCSLGLRQPQRAASWHCTNSDIESGCRSCT
jgi:hypothetical protein